ncbi:MAG: extracellular solute-binding protein, partial [Terriglobales bacterium]
FILCTVRISNAFRRGTPAAAIVLGLLTVSILAGCASGGGSDVRGSLGKAEGNLNLIAWPGLVENGSTEADVNWVGPFQDRTGCKVNVKTATSSDQMLDLINKKAYDGVSAPGELAGSLMADKRVEPINARLIDNYRGLIPALRNKPWNSQAGKSYGVPQGRSLALLGWRSDAVNPAPSSLMPLFDPASAYRGNVMMHDDPLSLAVTALALKASEPDLGINNPFALTKDQFGAVIDLARNAESTTSLYWTDYTEQVRAIEAKSATVGLMTQSVADLIQARGTKLGTALPAEGTIGSSDTWMLLKGAKHPSCMYRWMNHVLDPKTNAAMSEYYGQAPAVSAACNFTQDPGFCRTYHATDEEFYRNVWFATTPQKRCIGAPGKSCVGFTDWERAWQQLREG